MPKPNLEKIKPGTKVSRLQVYMSLGFKIQSLKCVSGTYLSYEPRSLLLFVCLWLYWVFGAACGLSLVVMCRLLTAMTSLVAECGLWSFQASVIVVHGLSCSEACGIFPDQGWNPCPLHWGFLCTGPAGKSPRSLDLGLLGLV